MTRARKFVEPTRTTHRGCVLQHLPKANITIQEREGNCQFALILDMISTQKSQIFLNAPDGHAQVFGFTCFIGINVCFGLL